MESQAHNLALIKLSQPIKFDRRISPICLPNPGKFTINNDLIDIKFDPSRVVEFNNIIKMCVTFFRFYLSRTGWNFGWMDVKHRRGHEQ